MNSDENEELPDGGYEEVERRGTHMAEIESYERLVEGLKLCADAARHLAGHKFPDAWLACADIFDMIRNNAVAMASKEGRHHDGVTGLIRTVYDPMDWTSAFMRLQDGLRQSSGAVRQLAVYHRADLRWLQMERSMLDLKAKATSLATRTSGLKPRLLN
jgi:hypothetical protein